MSPLIRTGDETLIKLTQSPFRKSAYRVGFLLLLGPWLATMPAAQTNMQAGTDDRSPVDLVVSPDNDWVAVVNQTTNSVSLADLASGEILDEQPCGKRPVSIVLCPDGRLLVSCSMSGTVEVIEVVKARQLRVIKKIYIGSEPQGIAVTRDGNRAYVARLAADDVVLVDLASGKTLQKIKIGRWPRQLALSPDNSSLAVATSGSQGISVVDTQSGTLAYITPVGINIGHLVSSKDNALVYFPWMTYRTNPITPGNIQRGWVLGSRVARVRLDGESRREAITLDPRGEAVADPHGIALTTDEQTLVVTASGTHEVLIYHLPELPFVDFGGPGDHIDPKLLRNPKWFTRVPLGGRPMGVRISPDNKTAYIANYLSNSVQMIDLQTRALIGSIDLGSRPGTSLARQGESIFYDAKYSLDQWYSCHTCHYEGGTNSVTMDTLNDDTFDSFKTVLPLYDVTRTGPWTWHGRQKDLRAAMRKSITSTMKGRKPTEREVNALIAFLETLSPPRSSVREPAGSIDEAARRGRRLFRGRGGCISCHKGPQFTDGEIHDVGLGEESDHHVGFNTPSLRGAWRKVLLLHDGRAASLREVIAGDHNPQDVSGSASLTEQEIHDLIAFLKTL